jgi:hypothetical protein
MSSYDILGAISILILGGGLFAWLLTTRTYPRRQEKPPDLSAFQRQKGKDVR